MSITLLQAPAAEPVSVAELTSYLRLVHDTEAALLSRCIVAARELVEAYAGRAMVARRLRETRMRWMAPAGGVVRLEFAPTPQIIAISVRRGGAEPVALSLPDDLDIDRGEFRLDLFGASSAAPGELRIDYDAGYGAAADAPQALRHATLAQAAHLFRERDSDGLCDAARALAAPFVRQRL